MNKFIGIDIACKTFVASIYQTKNSEKLSTTLEFSNDITGFKDFSAWLNKFSVNSKNSIICMEDTGCYHQKLAYFLTANNFNVCIEQPLKVKKAFKPIGHKTDAIDSQQIAEYAFRFYDKLTFWTPPSKILEKIKHLLSTRDLFVKQKTSIKNAKTSYNYNVVQVNLIQKSYDISINNLEKQIDIIDKELQKYIDQNPKLKKDSKKLTSITGFGNLLSLHLLVIIKDSSKELNYKKLSAFIGICPYKFQSGTSVNKKPRIRKFGSSKLKGLLRLAAMSVATHDKKYKEYYLKKQNEGKPKAVALNNIANKLLKVACAVLKNNNSNFIKEHYSVNPMYI